MLHGLDVLAGLDRSRDRASALVGAMRELFRRSPPPQLALERAVADLRHAFSTHIAKEERGMFPYVIAHAPGLGKVVARLSASHELLSAALVRLEQVVHRTSPARRTSDTSKSAFERFLALYAEHELSEARFLRRVDARLEDAERRELAAIVSSL